MIALLAIAVLSTGQFDEPEGPERPMRMQRNHSDRPLTLPEDLFAVWATLGGGQVTGSLAYVSFGAGAEYGIDDDLQVGLELLRLTMSSVPGSGLQDPIGTLTYRATRGIFELGVRGAVAVPLRNQFDVAIALPMLIRFAPIARLDLTPEAHAIAVEGWAFSASTTALFRIQLGNAVSIGALGIAASPNLQNKDFYARIGGRFTYTFGKENGGHTDLSITGISPALALAGDLPAEPNAERFFSVLVEVRVFIEDTFDSPFSEDL